MHLQSAPNMFTGSTQQHFPVIDWRGSLIARKQLAETEFRRHAWQEE
jgi:hypothetical protein